MPKIELSEAHKERVRHIVTIAPGEKVKLCRCWHSATFPLCDGSHRDYPGQGPCIVIAATEEPARDA